MLQLGLALALGSHLASIALLFAWTDKIVAIGRFHVMALSLSLLRGALSARQRVRRHQALLDVGDALLREGGGLGPCLALGPQRIHIKYSK